MFFTLMLLGCLEYPCTWLGTTLNQRVRTHRDERVRWESLLMQAVSTDHQEGKNARTVASTAQGGRRHRRQTGCVAFVRGLMRWRCRTVVVSVRRCSFTS